MTPTNYLKNLMPVHNTHRPRRKNDNMKHTHSHICSLTQTHTVSHTHTHYDTHTHIVTHIHTVTHTHTHRLTTHLPPLIPPLMGGTGATEPRGNPLLLRDSEEMKPPYSGAANSSK